MKNEYLHLKYSEIPLYRGYLVVILTNSCKKLKSRIPEFTDEELYAQCRSIPFKGRQGHAVVFNFHSGKRAITPGCIAHEAVHIAGFIASDRGFIPDFRNDEPIAYLVDWITDEIHKLVKKHNFKL